MQKSRHCFNSVFLILILILSGYAKANNPAEQDRACERLLSPILDQLNIYQRAFDGIEIKDSKDIVLDGNQNYLARRSILSFDFFPVEQFSVSPDGNLLALSWENRLGFLDENRRNQIVLIDVSGSEAKLVGVLNSNDPNFQTPDSIVFLTQNVIRVGRFKEKVEEDANNGLGYQVNYEFYDFSSHNIVSFNSLVEPLIQGSIVHVRAFSDQVYLVAYTDKTQGADLRLRYRFVFIEPSSESIEKWRVMLPQMPQRLTPEGLQNIIHNPVDERDVFAGPEKVAIHSSFLEEGEWQGYVIKVTQSKVGLTKIKDQEYNDGTTKVVRVHGNPQAQAIIDHLGQLRIKTKSGVKVWQDEALEHVYSSPTQVENGFVAVQGNHPNYAHLLLLPRGKVVILTDERLLLSVIRPDRLYGLSMRSGPSGTEELYFVRIPLSQ